MEIQIIITVDVTDRGADGQIPPLAS